MTNTWLSSKRDKRRHLCIELTRELRKIRLRARLPLLVEGTRVSEAVIGSEAAIGAAQSIEGEAVLFWVRGPRYEERCD